MSQRQHTSVVIGMIVAGLLAASGCSKEERSEHVESAADSVAKVTTETASSIMDSSMSPTDVSSSEMEDVEHAEPVSSPEPTDEGEMMAEEPPPDTGTSTPTEEVGSIDTPADASDGAQAAEGELVTVADTKPGLTRIGATKCKICHKVQYASWAESKHAERNPPLGCESCHGSGSEYKKKSIMEDPELARAAGLVMPDEAFCARCHRDDWQEGMLERAHAHKDDDAG